MKRLLASVALLLVMLVPASHAAAFDLFSGIKGTSACQGAAASQPDACRAGSSDPLTGANGILHKAATIISFLAGIAAVILIIISGIQFVTSGGDPQKVASARSALLGAVIGLVIIVLAQSIILFVLQKIR